MTRYDELGDETTVIRSAASRSAWFWYWVFPYRNKKVQKVLSRFFGPLRPPPHWEGATKTFLAAQRRSRIFRTMSSMRNDEKMWTPSTWKKPQKIQNCNHRATYEIGLPQRNQRFSSGPLTVFVFRLRWRHQLFWGWLHFVQCAKAPQKNISHSEASYGKSRKVRRYKHRGCSTWKYIGGFGKNAGNQDLSLIITYHDNLPVCSALWPKCFKYR